MSVVRRKPTSPPQGISRPSSPTTTIRRRKPTKLLQRIRDNGYHYTSTILKTAALLLLLYKFLLYFNPSWKTPPANTDNIINLGTIETLSSVPLGFTIDIPTDLGALEIYLDSQLISSIDDPASTGERTLNFGTCDILDHGENVLKHSFSLGSGELENMESIFLKPGDHIVEIEQREGKHLIPYAQMKVKVDAPPDLIVGSPIFRRSPYEKAYNLAIKEIGRNIACNHFVAGTGWSQLWTRDTSFAAELGAALIHPSVVRTSLMASTEMASLPDYISNPAINPFEKKVWLQDKCGHFGGWPNLSDAIVGTRGTWSLYLVTGDKEMLAWAFDVTKNSLTRAEKQVFDHDIGLFLGCSSFLESNSGYPEKYENDGELVGKTKALSTNMLYYAGYNLAAKMGRELGVADEQIHYLEEKALSLKSAIQRRLWSPSKSNYAYFEDEKGMQVDNTEGLGISLALLDFDDDDKRCQTILKSTHVTELGLTCLWPQFKYTEAFMEWRIPRHYHNGRLWPFVQGYWAMAAAHHKRVDLLSDAIKALTTLSQQGDTFAEFYELNATFPAERRRQLWSATGYLSMFYHGVLGIRMELEGIRFSPMKPKDLFQSDTIHLNGLKYRDMVLNIHLHGHGTIIKSFELDHQIQRDAFIKSDRVGVIDVDISLK